MDTDNSRCDHKHRFSSLQYELPFWMADKVLSWGRANVPDGVLYEDPDDPSYGREFRPHCTIYWGIHSAEFGPIRALMEGEVAFPITLGLVSLFSNSIFDVVKVEVFGADLYRLHERVGRGVPVTDPYGCYNPHVTVAYVKKGTCQRLVGQRAFTGQRLWVNSLVFSSKGGPKYHCPLMHRVPLAVFRHQKD